MKHALISALAHSATLCSCSSTTFKAGMLDHLGGLHTLADVMVMHLVLDTSSDPPRCVRFNAAFHTTDSPRLHIPTSNGRIATAQLEDRS